ncbi:ATP-grasp domain-containing protein [Corallococcus praedator]|uniref:ATP-grasp domain-containing protein n=1 Tax=Corallococcus praedator TaxID=2316724 RepID=A0ABX9QH53_9BACT|nr:MULTISPECIES: ATP-grasp domain-containing protein [Corallococcus]RKH28797.1 ATP-grasp domain-containing protein [Corallococcus sp. CA031C]RKI07832.1 ATP-grasp domain-containing protein [Corallococcus praedator]
MRIALTYNLRLSDTEEEAEFDTQETVNTLAGAIERLGHRLERFEVSGPASRTVARLEAYSPDLIFNTAEGRRGRFREAFYPALFDELGFAYTGSDAYALALTLDKQLTKLILSKHGIRTPGWQYVEKLSELTAENLHFPVIVKPNFEGSSKGITQDSVAETLEQVREKVAKALEKYPAGVLVEEYIRGRDLTVPFLAAVDNDYDGVLTPVEYIIDPEVSAGRKYAIYDYELKTRHEKVVSVRAPANIPPKIAEDVRKMAQKILQVLDCRDLGRLDFRLSDAGVPYFLEINALPSLEPGAGIYSAAELEGLHLDGVINSIIQSAAKRYKIRDSSRRQGKPARKSGPLRVGFAFNVKRVKPSATATGETVEDSEAEYDSPNTLQAIREAIASWGHEVIDLEATAELPTVLSSTPLDIVFNIAEGFKGRNRESQVPAMLELLDIPYTGSDPATLSLALDKALAKKIVRQAGILTPNFQLMVTGKERLNKEFTGFPLIVKPVAEGSSKGVVTKSVCYSETELRDVVKEIAGKYQQPALIEEYIGGREFTVGLLGERRPRVLPPMEIVFLDKAEKNPVYSFQHKLDWTDRIRYDAPAKLEPALLEKLRTAARNSFMALGCRDVARIDFRMDDKGRIYFIECNPLPGLTPGWSDLVLIAQGAGMDYRTLIGEIMAPAIRRYKEREARRAQTEHPPGPTPPLNKVVQRIEEQTAQANAAAAATAAASTQANGNTASAEAQPVRPELKS